MSSLVAKRGCLGCAWGQAPYALFLRDVCTSSLHSYWSIFGTPPHPCPSKFLPSSLDTLGLWREPFLPPIRCHRLLE